MIGRASLGICAILAMGVVAPATASARVLDLEERVHIQEVVERIYHAHRIGAPPFEQVVTRSILERKVRDTLRKSAALEAGWNAGITAAMLANEMERIKARTRFPERLEE